jgi:purine-binding chemotaxis protein CheW
MMTKALASPGRYLTFVLDNQSCAVPVEVVREINQYTDVTPLPNTPPFVAGVINLRGKIIPVVDLKIKFGLKSTERDRSTCIIVIDCDQGQVGAIVDHVQDVIDLEESNIEPPPDMRGEELSYLLGIGKVRDRVLILVDVMSALSKDNFFEKVKLTINQSAA